MLTRLNDEKRPDEILDAMTQTATSRRGLLAGGLTMALGAAAGMASAQNGMAPNRSGSRPPGSGGNGNAFESGGASGGASFNRSWANSKKKLLRKISYGPTAADVAEINALGYAAYLDKQINFEQIDDSACEAMVQSQYPLLSLTVEQLNQYNGVPWHPFTQAQAAMIFRAGLSKRVLYQRMTEFWMDHFYVWSGGSVTSATWADYARTSIWPNSMSTFKSLLFAVVQHGAMMVYLDNASSRMGQSNINYARELLELHTVGVDGGYAEADIYELAEILTGWGVSEAEPGSPDFHKFRFDPNLKSPGSRTVMGRTFSQAGQSQGEAVLNFLANHPSTIIHITHKLAEWFLGRRASSNLISRVANVWGTDGDIKAILRVILDESEIMKSNPIYKRPYHLVAGVFRQFGANSLNFEHVNGYLKVVKHTYEKHIQPDGFAHGFSFWSGGTINRFFVISRMCLGWVGFSPSLVQAKLSPLSEADKVASINEDFFLGELPVSDQIFIRRYLKRGNRPMEALSIALCSPSYQWF